MNGRAPLSACKYYEISVRPARLRGGSRRDREPPLERLHPRALEAHQPPDLDVRQLPLGHEALDRLRPDPQEARHLQLGQQFLRTFQ